MAKHFTWIVVVGALVAASAIAATAPDAPAAPEQTDPSACVAGPMSSAPVLACPHGRHGNGGCQGDGSCGCQHGDGEHQCNGDGSCGCGNFVDEDGDGVCDHRGQGNCGCGGGCGGGEQSGQ